MTTAREHIVSSISYLSSGVDGDERQAAAVLWTDPDRHWETIIGSLATDLEIVTLGSYDPDNRTGPAIWIRAFVAGLVGEDPPQPPVVVYMPGVGREAFRNIEECPDELRPLAELQYRGVFWTQKSGRDWTPIAYLQNTDRGLGVSVKSDTETIDALGQMLDQLIDRPVDWLKNREPVDASTLYSLVEADPVRTLLQWISEPASLQAATPGEQAAFRSHCKEEYGCDVDADGPIGAARKLANADGKWKAAWRRYREAPGQYEGIEERLRQAAASGQAGLALGFDQDDPIHAWPQHNEAEENSLRHALESAAGLPRDNLVAELDRLDAVHGSRRRWVWAQLGRAPLAEALLDLKGLAEHTPAIKTGSVSQLAEWYASGGWQAEDAMMRALASVSSQADRAAIIGVIDALYSKWSDHAARVFQQAVGSEPGAYRPPAPTERPAGTCLVFSDGLRLDLGHRLADQLRARGLTVSVDTHLAALPTITATAKPALAPIAGMFEAGPGLEPTTNGSTKVNAETLRKALNAGHYQTLGQGEIGDTSGRAWTEIGSIDRDGHGHELGLADRANDDLIEIAQRLAELVDAGWRTVEIVTDHGFLLMPTPMSKAELPIHLVEHRKGRCARLGTDDIVDYGTVPWRWDEDVRWAIAPGTSCFESGKRYEHGGVSLPECVVPHLSITRDATVQPVTLSRPIWRGMRVTVPFEGQPASVDLRTKPADPMTSVLESPLSISGSEAKGLVTDPDAEGMAAVVVALGEDGNLLGQIQTVIGEM